MDGNPLPDEVISFASNDFKPVYENGELIGYTSTIPVYDEGIWSWHDTLAGKKLYQEAYDSKLNYKGFFNADFTYGEVTPLVKPFIALPQIEIQRSLFLDFTLTQVSKDEWRRDSVILGQPYTYRFRRIVDGNGNRLPAWDDYIKAIEQRGPENALIPICLYDSGDSLPTACANGHSLPD